MNNHLFRRVESVLLCRSDQDGDCLFVSLGANLLPVMNERILGVNQDVEVWHKAAEEALVLGTFSLLDQQTLASVALHRSKSWCWKTFLTLDKINNVCISVYYPKLNYPLYQCSLRRKTATKDWRSFLVLMLHNWIKINCSLFDQETFEIYGGCRKWIVDWGPISWFVAVWFDDISWKESFENLVEIWTDCIQDLFFTAEKKK